MDNSIIYEFLQHSLHKPLRDCTYDSLNGKARLAVHSILRVPVWAAIDNLVGVTIHNFLIVRDRDKELLKEHLDKFND